MTVSAFRYFHNIVIIYLAVVDWAPALNLASVSAFGLQNCSHPCLYFISIFVIKGTSGTLISDGRDPGLTCFSPKTVLMAKVKEYSA